VCCATCINIKLFTVCNPLQKQYYNFQDSLNHRLKSCCCLLTNTRDPCYDFLNVTPKNWRENWQFRLELLLFRQKKDHNMGFQENVNFSSKVAIITLAPEIFLTVCLPKATHACRVGAQSELPRSTGIYKVAQKIHGYL
jgi:hypothetical protein